MIKLGDNIRCINAEHSVYGDTRITLTLGKIYKVLSLYSPHDLIIMGDNGIPINVKACRFELVHTAVTLGIPQVLQEVKTPPDKWKCTCSMRDLMMKGCIEHE